MNFILNKKLGDIVDGKSVVIVGPSPYLIGKSFGKIIDQHDVVCRVNDIIPRKHTVDYGSRTDIVFCCCNDFCVPDFEARIGQNMDVVKKMRLFVCNGMIADYYLRGSVDKNAKLICGKHGINLYILEKLNWNLIYCGVGIEQDSGTTSISTLLNYNLKNLTILGFSLYFRHKGEVYYPGYYDAPGVQNNNLPADFGSAAYLQKKYLKKLFNKHKNKLIVDEYLLKILELEKSQFKTVD